MVVLCTNEVAVFRVNPEVGGPQHVGVVVLPGLPVHGVLQVLGGDGPLQLLEDHVVVDHDAAAAEGLHLHPLEGLAQRGLEVDALQLQMRNSVSWPGHKQQAQLRKYFMLSVSHLPSRRCSSC